MRRFWNYRAAILALVFAGLIGSIVYLYVDRRRAIRVALAGQQQQLTATTIRRAELERTNALLQRSQVHYMRLYDIYAALERHRQ